MNIEDLIAFDLLTKEFVVDDEVVWEKNYTKIPSADTYTTIATFYPKLKGNLKVSVYFTNPNSSSAEQIMIAVYDKANNKLVAEIANSQNNYVQLVFEIEQPLMAYDIRVKRMHSSHSELTVTQMKLQGKIHEKCNFYVPLMEV